MYLPPWYDVSKLARVHHDVFSGEIGPQSYFRPPPPTPSPPPLARATFAPWEGHSVAFAPWPPERIAGASQSRLASLDALTLLFFFRAPDVDVVAFAVFRRCSCVTFPSPGKGEFRAPRAVSSFFLLWLRSRCPVPPPPSAATTQRCACACVQIFTPSKTSARGCSSGGVSVLHFTYNSNADEASC